MSPATPGRAAPSDEAGIGDQASRLRGFATLLWAVLLVAASARLELALPGSPVPQSAQTLAVLLVGLTLGPVRSVAALCLYLVAGAVGLPVFADGAGGWRHLAGPTAGYLVGFVVAAGLVGWATEKGCCRRFLPAFGIMLLAHMVILGLGWIRLGSSLGAPGAYGAGVAPFLTGALLKSAVAAVVAGFVTGLRAPTRAESRPLGEDG